MLVWKVGLIFLAYLFLNIILFFSVLYNQGKLVKNKIAFSAVQIYTIVLSILIMYQSNSKIQTYLVGGLFLVSAIGTIIIKDKDFFLARMITIELIVLVNIAMWYTSIHAALVIIILLIILGTFKWRENYKRRGY